MKNYLSPLKDFLFNDSRDLSEIRIKKRRDKAFFFNV